MVRMRANFIDNQTDDYISNSLQHSTQQTNQL